jgi:hypothetical protein
MIFRIAETEVVPARPRPLRHGVGFAPETAAVLFDIQPGLGFFQRPVGSAGRLEILKLWKEQGQFFRFDGMD